MEKQYHTAEGCVHWNEKKITVCKLTQFHIKLYGQIWQSAKVFGRFSQKSKAHTTCDLREGGACSYGQELQIIFNEILCVYFKHYFELLGYDSFPEEELTGATRVSIFMNHVLSATHA